MMMLTTLLLAGQPAAGQASTPQSFEQALAALDRGERERVAIGVFGASHVEAGKLTRRLRQRVGDRYGARGRGFIDPKPTKKVTPGDRVRRRVRGEHTWMNGHHVDDGEAMSLSGHKLRLGPGAQLEMSQCAGCAAPTHRDLGTVTVAGLNSDDAQGVLIIDDVVIGELTPNRADGLVRQLTARVRGDRHTVEVLHTSTGGRLELLSVVYERDTAGVIVDGLGLTGATGERFSAFDARVRSDQVRARDLPGAAARALPRRAGVAHDGVPVGRGGASLAPRRG